MSGRRLIETEDGISSDFVLEEVTMSGHGC